jgi:hypothetical protein
LLRSCVACCLAALRRPQRASQQGSRCSAELRWASQAGAALLGRLQFVTADERPGWW